MHDEAATQGARVKGMLRLAGLSRTETEVKLVARDSTALRRLPTALERICDSVRDLGSVRVSDRYLDTADWSIFRAGYACRLRRERGRLALALKTLRRTGGMVSVREEREYSVPAAPPSAQWATVRRRLRHLVGDAPLKPLFRIVNRRRKRRIRLGRELDALVTADSFTVEACGRSWRRSEVEVELIRGSNAALVAFAKRLAKELRLTASGSTKFHEGLRLAGLRPDGRRWAHGP